MRFFLNIVFCFLVFFIMACATIENKSQQVVKKENEKLSKFLNQPESELKIVMGNPDDEIKDNKGVRFLIYKSKKYTIACERKFEINESKTCRFYCSICRYE